MTFDEAKETDTIVRNVFWGEESIENFKKCICILAEQKKELVERIFKLQLIAPTRIRKPDDSEVLWRCPEDLIPLTDFSEKRNIR